MRSMLKNKKKIWIIIGGILVFALIGYGFRLMVDNQNRKVESVQATEMAAAQAATLAAMPTETVMQAVTLEPSPTPTQEPTPEPTSTPIPPLGLTDQGFLIWSVPPGTGFVPANFDGTSTNFAEVYDGYEENDIMNIKVPAGFIVAEVYFNQAMPSGLELKVLEKNSGNAWYKVAVTPYANDTQSGYFMIRHEFMLNPPYWEITYPVKIEAADGKVYLEKNVRFYKTLPNPCWDGSLPNPVTLYCPNYDGDWNYLDFENFNPNADLFIELPLPEYYLQSK